MWSSVIAILAVAALAAGDENAPTGFRQYFEPRLGASGVRLARLEKELAELNGRLAEAKKIDPQGFIDDMNDRIDHVEAASDHCDSAKEIRCGFDTEECVNTLLLCDGTKDCHNGFDEDAKTCSSGPAKAGNVFTGTATWVSCQNVADHPVKITITGVAKVNFFGARLLVRGKVSADFVDAVPREYEVKGYYIYGQKRLYLFPLGYTPKPRSSQELLGVECGFVHGNDVSAECIFIHEGCESTCAKFHVTLQQ